MRLLLILAASVKFQTCLSLYEIVQFDNTNRRINIRFVKRTANSKILKIVNLVTLESLSSESKFTTPSLCIINCKNINTNRCPSTTYIHHLKVMVNTSKSAHTFGCFFKFMFQCQ